jgi:hypothetical protein
MDKVRNFVNVEVKQLTPEEKSIFYSDDYGQRVASIFNTGFVRKSSLVWTKECPIYDTEWGVYRESDSQLRERIKNNG